MAVLCIAACGGKKPAATLSNEAPKPAAGLADGSYACEFVLDGTAFGPHHCQITGTKLDKTSGMEPFTGTIAGNDHEVKIMSEIGCTDLSVACHHKFTLTLNAEAGGMWRGKVSDSADPGWWLNTATFELGPEGSLGGEGYGGGGNGGGSHDEPMD